MKVELNDLVLAVNPLTDEVFIGVPEKRNPRIFRHKKTLTDNFYQCAMQKWDGFEEEVESSSGKKYKISITEIKS